MQHRKHDFAEIVPDIGNVNGSCFTSTPAFDSLTSDSQQPTQTSSRDGHGCQQQNCLHHSCSGTESSNLRMSVLKETTAAVSVCLCMFVTGSWLAWPSPALKKLQAEGGANVLLDEAQSSWAVALLDVGNMISPIPTGFLVDRLGRKNVLLSAGPLYLACWLLTFVPGSPYYLYLSRFLAGIGKGVTFTVCPMYLGEIASVNIRGALSTIATGFLWGGSLFMFIVGPRVSYQTMNIAGAIFPILFFLTFLFMPDSPYGLLMCNKYEAAKKSLQWLRCSDGIDTEKELEHMKDNVEEEMKTKGSFKDLITVASNRKATTIVMVSSGYQRLCGISAILAFSSTTIPATSGISFLESSNIIVIFGILLTVGNFLATPAVDSLGRKPLLLISSIGIAVLTAASGFYYLLRTSQDQAAWIPYSCLILFGIFHSIGLGVIPSTLLSELFPSNVKSRAAAVSSIVFALGSFITNKMYNPVKNGAGVHYMYFFFCFNALTYTCFGLFYLFETKGKTFPEIQQRLRGVK